LADLNKSAQWIGTDCTNNIWSV